MFLPWPNLLHVSTPEIWKCVHTMALCISLTNPGSHPPSAPRIKHFRALLEVLRFCFLFFMFFWVFFRLKTWFESFRFDLFTDECLPLKVYPYEMLMITSRGRAKLPRDVDRTRLEVSDSHLSVFDTTHLSFCATESYTNLCNECAVLIVCHFCSEPFCSLGANPLAFLCFSPLLFSILASLSAWNVLWHLWNGDPGVWQASPVETQRHEKEGQALLALKQACTYCTFIQIAQDSCHLDAGFCCLFFSVSFFLCSLFYSCIIKEAEKWTLFAPAFLRLWPWVIHLFRFCTEHYDWEPLPCSKMTKNEW